MQSSLSFEELCDRYEDCYDFMHDAGEILMQFDGVVGVGIGPKEYGGALDPDQPCFIVYVNEKKPGTELAANAYIPREFSGVVTDVVAVGSRGSDIHNEFDKRWLALSRESFTGFFLPETGKYKRVS